MDGIVLIVQLLALAREHRHIPGNTLFGIGAFLTALMARLSKAIDYFLAMQQSVALGDINYVARGAAHGMSQSRVSVYTNVSLYAKVPLLAVTA